MKKAFLQLHLSIVCSSFTGIFGKLITLSAGLLVFWRIMIACSCLWLWLYLRKQIEKTTRRDKIGMLLVGVLLAIHWTFFYASIKTGNVSVTIVSFSTIGFFTALVEPLMTKRRIDPREIFFSCISLAGVMCIFGFNTSMRLCIVLSLLAAFTAAILAVYFKKYRARYRSTTVLSWQLLGALGFCFAAMPLYFQVMPPEPFWPGWPNTLWLPIFAIFSTLFMYILQISSLEKISAFTVNLTYNLEPVYTIILAFIIFDEHKNVSWPFYVGITLIGLAVLLTTLSTIHQRRRADKAMALKEKRRLGEGAPC